MRLALRGKKSKINRRSIKVNTKKRLTDTEKSGKKNYVIPETLFIGVSVTDVIATSNGKNGPIDLPDSFIDWGGDAQ